MSLIIFKIEVFITSNMVAEQAFQVKATMAITHFCIFCC